MLMIRALVLAVGVLLVLVVGGCTSPSPDPGYTVALETQPSPMQSSRVGTLLLRVEQANGTPLTGARVSFVPEHKGMAHSKPTINTQEREPGVYAGEYMPSMAGDYRVTVTIEGAQGRVQRTLDTSVR